MNKTLELLENGRFTIDNICNILGDTNRNTLESIAVIAQNITRRNFGRTISLYAPLYLSNYCVNRCVYCGFHAGREIEREILDEREIEQECEALARNGFQSVLLLTGESRKHTPPEYLQKAVAIASRFFQDISLEIYPLDTDEYRELYLFGADGVTLYQETYDRERYDAVHLTGPKKNYEYRFTAPERIARAGFRRISMGVLLGLHDWREDVVSLFRAVRYLEKNYPGVEYSLSFPRIRIVSGDKNSYNNVSDEDMVRIICSARILFPRTGIVMSTRESPDFRDRMIGLGVTRISAGSSTRVGGYAMKQKETDPQFEVYDYRSPREIITMLKKNGYEPVFTDWRRIGNDIIEDRNEAGGER